MEIIPTKLKDCYILQPQVFGDERGYFYESFHAQKFSEVTGLAVTFVQDNQSSSSYGVIRGLHYQKGAAAQAKLVRVISGKVIDVAVDLRPGSSTYGQYEAVELSAENRKQLFVPRGFAHGFSVLSESAEFVYKCDNYYNPNEEGGIIFNDPKLNIDWGIPHGEEVISEKDLKLPRLS
ncbi:dTDP-4-dehydrorhamnose 3,5-epimerase [Flammeovirga kamogawensis]|uniref:dTDP-4-dehydrorhamnose 3,5-epimerase n=1 Tax=Flammeovirga kamogawensis TaxID=373891 RepID=A0ABX8GSK9_9BACT|nr:dTDP-4-dehydrorhamnose 3,5-epimerase [Flammeovirga kamogawensis]MBB6461518.1 dTDP-4-dehydrorhamnose 3,5-epimerase [Flammeovirga kamogawensis]QWG06409.1 dTDP-4-dehydrorhamnose 3,5-epimerase [Flammeovirga kamogawensis]TRX68239.1 dTDP-4-dehydrorhamnose 3,5-epimerase [Flammeovirga kamogawensis]